MSNVVYHLQNDGFILTLGLSGGKTKIEKPKSKAVTANKVVLFELGPF